MTSLWHRAVADAEDEPRSTEDAIRAELRSLWGDLANAMRMAYKGNWSVGCDDVAGRIIRLSRAIGSASWESVPITLLLNGTYHGLMADAGIEHDQPGEGEQRKMQAWHDEQIAAARR